MTKKALISPNEKRGFVFPDGSVGEGWRVAEVAEQIFPVAEPLFWADCSDELIGDAEVYNPENQSFYPLYNPFDKANQPQPISSGGIETL